MKEYQIPGTWETVESFDFSTVITQQDQNAAMTDIRQLILEDKFFKNSPRYQTNVNVFGLEGEHWLKFKFSFLMSCFMYLKKEVKIDQVQSWSFMTSNTTVEDRDTLWHTHQYGSERTLSGIYYLHIPSDADPATSGTEFATHGMDNPDRWTSPVKNFNWIIYPGKTWHRPCPPQSSQDRFVIAADMVF
jgi:hypothetical protein